ncbi:MAG: hypothetical protein HUJ26_17055 [Planctomycetaceae bacterium]|nr:hypothetical protein [Planctomycetaceae bacterium]
MAGLLIRVRIINVGEQFEADMSLIGGIGKIHRRISPWSSSQNSHDRGQSRFSTRCYQEISIVREIPRTFPEKINKYQISFLELGMPPEFGLLKARTL